MQKCRSADVQMCKRGAFFMMSLNSMYSKTKKQILSHFREFVKPLCPKMFSGGFFDRFEHSSGYMRSGPDVVGI